LLPEIVHHGFDLGNVVNVFEFFEDAVVPVLDEFFENQGLVFADHEPVELAEVLQD
jgi:hypothetical protein